MALLRNRVLSHPCEVIWAGFRSNTFHLQQSGWEIAAEENPYDGRVRLLLGHNGMRLFALSNFSEFNYFRSMQEYQSPPIFHVVHVSPRIEVLSIKGDNFDMFKKIDAAPQFINHEIKSVDDMGIFAAPLVRTEEIIIDPADVSAMLEKIRQMQLPEQEAIRMRNRMRENIDGIVFDRIDSRPRQSFHAQIISLERKIA